MRRSQPRHPASLLPLWDIWADTLVTTQGCYLRGFRLHGLHSEPMDTDALKTTAEALYRAARTDLPEGLFLQFVVEGHSNNDPVLGTFSPSDPAEPSMLTEQRKARQAFLQAQQLRRVDTRLFVGAADGMRRRDFQALSEAEHGRRWERAKALARSAARFFKQADVLASPLSGEAMEAVFSQNLNPGWMPPPPVHIPEGLPSHAVLALTSRRERLFRASFQATRDGVCLGKQFAKVLTLKTLPDATYFSLMEAVLQVPFDFRLSVNMMVPEQKHLRSAFQAGRRMAHADAHRNPHVPDDLRAAKVKESDVLSELLAESGQKLVRVGMQVVLSAHTPSILHDRIERFQEIMGTHGFGFFEETGAHDEAFFRTLPGMATTFDRWKLVTSHNAVDLMPIFAMSHGDRRPIFLVQNTYGGLYSYDPVEEKRDNWNATVFGASGAGKSVFMNLLITHAMRSNVTRGRLMVVDFVGETKSAYRQLAERMGGRFIPILSQEGGFGLNPFPEPADALDAEGNVRGEMLHFLTVLTDILVANTDTDMEAQLHRQILQGAIQRLYRQHPTGNAPTYHDLLTVLTATKRDNGDEARRSTLARLIQGFLDSPESKLFLSEAETAYRDELVIFDLFGIDALPKHLREALVFLVCHRVKRLAFDPHDPGIKYVVMDEVAQLLRNPAMKALVHELYSTARKHRTSIWTVTQKYEDYVESAVAGTINLNSTSQLFLSHARAADSRRRIAEDFSLNPREAYLFEQLVTRKGSYSEVLLRTEVFDEARGEKWSVSAKLRVELSPVDAECLLG
jgi:type IV secretory pathway VirB4 component